MEYMSATELCEAIGGVVSARTIRKWAREGLISQCRQLPNGQLIFLPEAAREIVRPMSPSAGTDDDAPLGEACEEMGLV